MNHPLLRRHDDEFGQVRYYDSEAYVYGIEISPIKGVCNPQIVGEKKDVAVVLPDNFFKSAVSNYKLTINKYYYDGNKFEVATVNNVCIITGEHIPLTHTYSLVNKLYQAFCFKEVVTVDFVDSIGEVSTLSTESDSKFTQLKPPYHLKDFSAAFYTLCVMEKLKCESFVVQEDTPQIEKVLSYIREHSGLADIQLPVVSYSFSTLYA
ncbi:hypothetical protein EIN_283730 [Entamoeba invadens IP1]|uniref:Uncharacterized protein n=1 Tax=Entamoeba invadens IP1 TaxID=370355 RepID=L7FK81_ENTIV|nr:hypothetical protein EIN_283730 [Entamoeba invadens IP1]ELP84827.1 hypothetical protein EIN_283730 [Entamoeba invadens IP1]|eukprot:XP_004184173.1 hypothetical protein EIN_283730 [Entamoeba invadens IP1]